MERQQRALSEASSQLASQSAAAERERVRQAELAEQVAALRRGIEDAAQREQAYTKQLRERDEAYKAQTRELERSINDNSFLQRSITEKDEKVSPTAAFLSVPISILYGRIYTTYRLI